MIKNNIFRVYFIFTCLLLNLSCENKEPNSKSDISFQNYLSYQYRKDQYTGGVKLIPIITNYGVYKVWTKQVGNNPQKRVLLLHGGPGSTHEIFECFDAFFPQEQIEYIYYDQLESFYSDQPNNPKLWSIPRFVDEIEQLRVALGLDQNNFILLGHSWGAILAMEYALKYQQNLKGMVVCNMMSSMKLYNDYAHKVVAKDLQYEFNKEDQKIIKNKLDEQQYDLFLNKIYTSHIIRKPIENWPDPAIRAFTHINDKIYIYMQGSSDIGVEDKAYLKNWDIQRFLARITVPTLVVGAKYDMMDPEHLRWMSKVMGNGQFLYCPYGSDCPMYDDQEIFFKGVIKFIEDLK